MTARSNFLFADGKSDYGWVDKKHGNVSKNLLILPVELEIKRIFINAERVESKLSDAYSILLCRIWKSECLHVEV